MGSYPDDVSGEVSPAMAQAFTQDQPNHPTPSPLTCRRFASRPEGHQSDEPGRTIQS